jgi:methylenetetrahydrofolate--tRNA-(uracil-5-)-methyltransferase
MCWLYRFLQSKSHSWIDFSPFYTYFNTLTISLMSKPDLIVIGGGLAGSEAAWQAAQRGLIVRLYEMRPTVSTGAHQTSDLAELVCSNSLGSNLPDRASGMLKNELRRLGSLLMECAETAALPADAALAVDREIFSRLVTERLSVHPGVEIVHEEVVNIPTGLTIIASGPLTSKRLSQTISALTGEEHLHFYDAIAPIVSANSINMGIAYRASRYGPRDVGVGDYINCPLTKGEYDAFVEALLLAKRIKLLPFETKMELCMKAGAIKFFEGCLPLEIIAQRSRQALTFGPMRPAGLTDPRTVRWPYALVQLRQDNLAGSLYNLVGFQTNLTYSAQKQVFHLIPGLEQAEFVRYGQMHRNTFIAAPKFLLPTLQFRNRTNLFFGGQINGVEGYMGNIATGLLAGLNAARLFHGQVPLILPETTMLGALCHYITHADLMDFQPMKANFGVLPPLAINNRMDKNERSRLFAERAQASLESFLAETSDL